jgi:hypothetical protein
MGGQNLIADIEPDLHFQSPRLQVGSPIAPFSVGEGHPRRGRIAQTDDEELAVRNARHAMSLRSGGNPESAGPGSVFGRRQVLGKNRCVCHPGGRPTELPGPPPLPGVVPMGAELGHVKALKDQAIGFGAVRPQDRRSAVIGLGRRCVLCTQPSHQPSLGSGRPGGSSRSFAIRGGRMSGSHRTALRPRLALSLVGELTGSRSAIRLSPDAIRATRKTIEIMILAGFPRRSSEHPDGERISDCTQLSPSPSEHPRFDSGCTGPSRKTPQCSALYGLITFRP